jgi:hypothetical protein
LVQYVENMGKKNEVAKKNIAAAAPRSLWEATTTRLLRQRAVKGSDREEEKDGDAAAALTHAVAPKRAPSVYSCGGAEVKKGFDGDSAATFSHAVAPLEAPSAAAAGLYGEWRSYN